MRVAAQGLAVGQTVRLQLLARDLILAINEPQGLSVRNNLRGRVIPVIDLRVKFGLPADFSERTCIIVAQVAIAGSTILGLLVAWVIVNTVILAHIGKPFDPYPFVFLNLILSMLAAIQAPVIMMSQNRQSTKDRAAAEHDYEVNLKAELEILSLHRKVDGLCEQQWLELVAMQRQQIEMLTRLIDSGASPPKPANAI